MDLSSLYILVLITSLSFLFAQLLIDKKQSVHLLFALFCGSVAMVAAKKMSAAHIGDYQYLFGMAACLTCNGYWLLSRSLFRGKNAISAQHVFFAGAIALLVIANQGYMLVNNEALAAAETKPFAQFVLGELTVLLSSVVIVLSFWEGCRGFKQDTEIGKKQRLLFLATFGFAVGFSKLAKGFFIQSPEASEIIINLITLFVLINTQVLMLWRYRQTTTQDSEAGLVTERNTADKTKLESPSAKHLTKDCGDAIATSIVCHPEELALATKVEQLLTKESLYLQANLKVADIARELDVPEYRVSKALRNHLQAKNFNQYVNNLRIDHAKALLTDPDKQKWPVLVVGLESGFASVGPFTRTFKLLTGYTPNQYRQHQLCHGE